ncbi:MAG: ion transporter [Longimicrobiales bacterium]
MAALGPAAPPDTLRGQTYEVIFGHEPGWGRRFDAILIAFIIASVSVVMMDSVSGLRSRYGPELLVIEWAFTLLFTLEYVVRIWCVKNVRAYVFSFFGIIDLLSVLPTYLSLLLPGGQYLAVIRVLRVVRVFRVFKLVRFLGEASLLSVALRNARYKIAVFLVTVLCIVIVVGSVMYLVEGPEGGFTSIPKGVYWAIVTLTTVGYGDVAPTSALGQALAALVMILGYGIIAVPTGIVTAEIASLPGGGGYHAIPCPSCENIEVDPDAKYCRFCGVSLRHHA